MKKIEDFELMRKRTQADKQKIAAMIEDLIRQESELNDAANAAAEAGDVDLYEAKSKELEKIRATIFVRRKQMDKLCPFTDSEVMESWSDYAKTFNRSFEKKIAEYEKQAKAVREAFLDLVRTQNEALIARERYAGMVSDPEDLNKIQLVMLDNKNGKPIGGNMYAETADIRFCRMGCTSAEEDQKMAEFFGTVVNQRAPYIN